MRILLVNDDGVHAPGIKSLYSHLKEKHQVVVVAPLEERSATSHTLSLDAPLRIDRVSEGLYGCSGYPADCSLLAIRHLLAKEGIEAPQLVLSGCNRGANLAQDIYYSGTVAAAREAIFHHFPSIALSLTTDFQINDGKSFFFDSASIFARHLLETDVVRLLPPMTVLNINVPNLPLEQIKGVKFTSLGFRHYSGEIEERRDFRGKPYYWIASIHRGHQEEERSDCQAIEEHFISLTVLNVLGQYTDNQKEWFLLVERLNQTLKEES